MKEKIETFSKLMRPVFGYVVAFSWGAQMLSVAFVILFKTNEAASVINAMDSLSTTWAVGLSVLGIYVYRKSSEPRNSQNTRKNFVNSVSSVFQKQKEKMK